MCMLLSLEFIYLLFHSNKFAISVAVIMSSTTANSRFGGLWMKSIGQLTVGGWYSERSKCSQQHPCRTPRPETFWPRCRPRNPHHSHSLARSRPLRSLGKHYQKSLSLPLSTCSSFEEKANLNIHFSIWICAQFGQYSDKYTRLNAWTGLQVDDQTKWEYVDSSKFRANFHERRLD